MSTRRQPSRLSEKKLIKRVRPGVLLVRASLLLAVMALSALDLPALDRPAKATSAPASAGHSSSLEALNRKRALLKEMFFCVRSESTVISFPLDFSCR